MDFSELIGSAITELELAKKFENKKNYRIDELIIEVNVSEFTSSEGKLDLTLFKGGINQAFTNTHKITVKLKPSNRHNRIDVSVNT